VARWLGQAGLTPSSARPTGLSSVPVGVEVSSEDRRKLNYVLAEAQSGTRSDEDVAFLTGVYREVVRRYRRAPGGRRAVPASAVGVSETLSRSPGSQTRDGDDHRVGIVDVQVSEASHLSAVDVLSASCNAVRVMTPRGTSEDAKERRKWIARLQAARLAVDDAERERDELVRQAQAAGLSVRAIASALGVDKGTVSRRYPRIEP
jgi:hypothetical protein